MEISRWKKDETSYLIFSCSKCKRWLYVKITQKTKKCLNCNKSHPVQKMMERGYIVSGLSNAIATIKQKQNELALEEMGSSPDLKTEKAFIIPNNCSLKKAVPNPKVLDGDHEETFKALLIQLSKKYKQFPKYLIMLLAKEYELPNHQISILISRFTKLGLLIPLKNNYYTLKNLSLKRKSI